MRMIQLSLNRLLNPWNNWTAYSQFPIICANFPSDEVLVICLEWGADSLSTWCHCIPKPHQLLPLLFCYWRTQVVLKKRPLKGCSSMCQHTHTHTHTRLTALFPGQHGWAGTRKVIPIWILQSRRQWVAVVSAGPYASLHLTRDT